MKRANLATRVYDHIKKNILSLTLPPGGVLQERLLAEELGVSRTPVREAVHRLSQEGWLLVNARKNIQVRTLSMTELHDVFMARQLLERDVIDEIMSSGHHRETVRRMTVLLQVMAELRGDSFSFVSTDQAFHSVPFAVLGNACLMKFWQFVSEDMIWFGMLAVDENRYPHVLTEHHDIVDAIARGQKKKAQAALLEHLEITEDILIRKISDGTIALSQGS